MRKYGIIVAVLLLLVAAAMAQNVIKYSLTSSSALAIGRAVKLGATDNTCVLAGAADGDSVIGFVGMTETAAGPTYYNLIVNAGRITAAISGASGAVSIGSDLTAAAAGSLKVAGVGDRVIAKATQAVATPPGACEIMIQLEPITTDSGARLWQAAQSAMTSITGSASGDQSLVQIAIATACDVEDMQLLFTGTADDKDGNGGAVVNVSINDGTSDLSTQTLYLVDRHFYQSQAVAVSARKDVSPTDTPTFDVYVWESDGMTDGRIKGVFTIVGTPR